MARRREPVAAEQRRDRWRRTIGQWQASGLSQAEFCRRQGIAYSQFAWWRRRASAEQPATVEQPAEFLPLGTLRLPRPRLEVVLTNGRRLRFGPELAPEQLAGLVAVLDGPAVEDRSC